MICYLVLHYKNTEDTEKCIESILKISNKEDHIIVVDNGSGDGSGLYLDEKYKENYRIKIIISDKNIGFSKGNNLGYKYIREKYNPKFIVVTNNDVVFWQSDFQEKVNNIYNRTKFDVLGPDVFIPDNNEHQNPLFLKGITIPELEKELAEYKAYLSRPETFERRLQLHKWKGRLCSHFWIVRKLNSVLRKREEIDYKKEYINVGLQGSCLIVSENYIKQEEKMFDPEPFLYCEEVFLYYKCKKMNYKMVYSPLIKIRHEEAASFKNANKNNTKRLEFMLQHHVMARELLLEYLKML